MFALYNQLDAAGKKTFMAAYSASYKPAKDILAEIYDEVTSWPGSLSPDAVVYHQFGQVFWPFRYLSSP